jgi:membrane associated rhomboid family serine protease
MNAGDSFSPAPQPWVGAGPPRRSPAWVTWTIFGTTVAVFLYQLIELHTQGDDIVGSTLAFSPSALGQGRWWTLLSYAWVHAVAMFGDSHYFWLHIVANMIPLICLGPALEAFLGHLRFLGLYLGGAVAAAFVWFLLNRDMGDQGIIGASGAIFALIAGAGTALPRARVRVYILYVLPVSMTLGFLAGALCVAEAAQAWFGWLPEISHSAHLGGAAFGFLYVAAVRLTGRRAPG